MGCVRVGLDSISTMTGDVTFARKYFRIRMCYVLTSRIAIRTEGLSSRILLEIFPPFWLYGLKLQTMTESKSELIPGLVLARSPLASGGRALYNSIRASCKTHHYHSVIGNYEIGCCNYLP